MTKKRVTITITPTTWRDTKACAGMQTTSVSHVIDTALHEYFNNHAFTTSFRN